jgi:hypothetical protein
MRRHYSILSGIGEHRQAGKPYKADAGGGAASGAGTSNESDTSTPNITSRLWAPDPIVETLLCGREGKDGAGSTRFCLNGCSGRQSNNKEDFKHFGHTSPSAGPSAFPSDYPSADLKR